MPKKLKIGKAYKISWLDHYLLPNTWTQLENDPADEKAECYSYGVVVKDESLYYTIAGSGSYIKTLDGKVSNIAYGDVNRILKSAITGAKEIK